MNCLKSTIVTIPALNWCIHAQQEVDWGNAQVTKLLPTLSKDIVESDDEYSKSHGRASRHSHEQNNKLYCLVIYPIFLQDKFFIKYFENFY